jgi:putative AlgH/UPF0301 family transcriptional regulator
VSRRKAPKRRVSLREFLRSAARSWVSSNEAPLEIGFLASRHLSRVLAATPVLEPVAAEPLPAVGSGGKFGAGGLLVAHPCLGGVWSRSVVLITRYNPRGDSEGVLLNKPLTEEDAEELGESAPEDLTDLETWYGGPCRGSGVLKYGHGRFAVGGLSDSEDGDEPVAPGRAILGKVVWKSGKLHQELGQGFWFRVPAQSMAPADLPEESAPDVLWKRAMASHGPIARELSRLPVASVEAVLDTPCQNAEESSDEEEEVWIDIEEIGGPFPPNAGEGA